ncbi:hypothetical protein [Mesorhizobium opportunistum]|uniref:Uncharacterized protein n=1 Tax=Mesorhizobium opportunistum (strain LMG 24607 / HAMBI 3007 / WSM2075) TaxID=536019 RepID=F7Y9P3_MESOW|nr:hypothetical protein [Mesorhizobium opportunistum]AEH88769.1 hypothetical protein Mesop_4339 [Mesorhizobium opportunistum WSM2075]
MDIQAPVWPVQQTAKELVCETLLGSQPGDIISVKATIAEVRERGRELHETDCQLVAMIVDFAVKRGLFVAFDVREP